MRYEDWDALIFPATSTVPQREFHTTCFLVQDGQWRCPTLVTYIPSLHAGAPITVSLHAWTKIDFGAELRSSHYKLRSGNMAFGIRVIVDDICVVSTTFMEGTEWPQSIDTTDPIDVKGTRTPLLFPMFNRSILSRREWNIQDGEGRIKVLVTEGIRTFRYGNISFQPVTNIICFSFQPAPIELLQDRNIAWPNAKLLENPWSPSHAHAQTDTRIHLSGNGSSDVGSRSEQGRSSIGRGGGRYQENMHAPPPLARLPLKTFLDHPYHQSTTWLNDIAPLAPVGIDWAGPPTGSIRATPPSKNVKPGSQIAVRQGSSTMRLTSDQMQQIITAIKESNAQAEDKLVDSPQRPSSSGMHPGFSTHAQVHTTATRDTSPRSNRERNTSDITMHASCTGFPECLVNHPITGELVHCTPSRPTATTTVSAPPAVVNSFSLAPTNAPVPAAAYSKAAALVGKDYVVGPLTGGRRDVNSPTQDFRTKDGARSPAFVTGRTECDQGAV